MDDNDLAVREELERRLAVIEREDREAPRPSFPRADLVLLIALVVVSVVIGLLVGIS